MWEQSLMTCRFCGESGYDHDDFVKYGVRHYAHHHCYLKAGKPLNDLHDWQIIQFPYRVLEEFGHTGDAHAAQERLRERGED